VPDSSRRNGATLGPPDSGPVPDSRQRTGARLEAGTVPHSGPGAADRARLEPGPVPDSSRTGARLEAGAGGPVPDSRPARPAERCHTRGRGPQTGARLEAGGPVPDSRPADRCQTRARSRSNASPLRPSNSLPFRRDPECSDFSSSWPPSSPCGARRGAGWQAEDRADLVWPVRLRRKDAQGKVSPSTLALQPGCEGQGRGAEGTSSIHPPHARSLGSRGRPWRSGRRRRPSRLGLRALQLLAAAGYPKDAATMATGGNMGGTISSTTRSA
jgi:hypothetical protein